jgi:hydroxyethylthiazole kinase-like uncharacterized protein yjeF
MTSLFGPADAASRIAVPGPDDDKYSRGVLGFVTGSARYPGAAVLGVEAALRTGVGMVRYLGPGRPTRLVLQHRPEAVTADGRVQAWVLGSGQDAAERDDATRLLLESALGQGVPVVLDGGGLDLTPRGPAILTPHAGELARVLGVDRATVLADRESAVRIAVEESGATILLKGHETLIAGPDRLEPLRVRNAPAWLATAGAGDALAGIIGALLATHPGAGELPELAATAAVIHGLAAERASGGGPFTILDLCAEIPRVVAALVASSVE